ncbi:MBL fold metallo-hydrolase [Thermodesulfobacteriota bacterium]
MIKVTDQIFVETSFVGSNVGCIITEQGLVLVDTPMFPDEAAELRTELRKISDLDIAYVIYTHQHFDHVVGGTFLTKRAIACKAALGGIAYLKKNLDQELKLIFPDLYEEKREAFRNLEIVLPQITFNKELTLHMGDKTLELTFAGGHSSASIMIYVPEDRVLLAGDNIVTGMPPFTANCRFGSWIELLGVVEKMEIDSIVPGHGEVCGKEVASMIRIYFENMRDQVRSLSDAGVAKDEIVKKINLNDVLPVPATQEVLEQMAFDVSRMYDHINKGFL